MKTKYNQVLTSILLLFGVFAFSQKQISGSVTDESGVPLPGAAIVESGTNNGTSSDFDGKFTINLENDDSKLEISYIGYKTESFDTSNVNTIDAILLIDSSSLDEIVVTGYGTQLKKILQVLLQLLIHK